MKPNIQPSLIRPGKKLCGIVTPVRAEDTGLIPHGYAVYITPQGVRRDRLEGDVDLAKVGYVCPLREDDGDYIGGETMLKRADELKVIGSLGLAFALLKAQGKDKAIFPAKSRGIHNFIMPLTELTDECDEGLCVAYFHWSDISQRWVLGFSWVGNYFDRNDRFVVLTQE